MAPLPTAATPNRNTATSRLLAMKFMNRLGPGDSSPTASSSTPSTPTGQASTAADEEPSSKRRRVAGAPSEGTASPATGAAAGSPGGEAGQADGQTMAEMEATMRASMDEEERRRQQAITKRAAELGDEHWTWNAQLPPAVAAKLAAARAATQTQVPYNVVRVGYAEIDQSLAADKAGLAGHGVASAKSTKPTILRFNMKHVAADDDDDDDEGEEADQKPSKKRSRSDMEQHSKRKEVSKLKGLTSLSGHSSTPSSMKCHRCGKPGHKAMECPLAPKRTGSKRR